MGLGSTGKLARIWINAVDHNSLNSANQVLILFPRNRGLDIHHFLPAVFLFLFADLAVELGGASALFLGVFEYPQPVEFSGFDKIQELGEILIGFAGKADNHRSPQCQSGNRLTQLLNSLAHRAAAFAAAHALQQSGADMLKGDIDIFADLAGVGDQIEQFCIEKVGIGVEQADPLDVIDLGQSRATGGKASYRPCGPVQRRSDPGRSG